MPEPHSELASRLHEQDPLLTPTARAAMDPATDPADVSEEDFLATLESLSQLNLIAEIALRRMIADRPAELGPSMRSMASATHLSHSTVFRIAHDGPSAAQKPRGEA